MAEAFDLVVDRGVLLDVGVGGRDVPLVVVVIGDEVLHRVLGERLAELVGELGGQRLVGRDDDGRALGASTTLAIVKVLPVPVAPSSVMWLAGPDALDQVVDGRLVAGLERGRRGS